MRDRFDLICLSVIIFCALSIIVLNFIPDSEPPKQVRDNLIKVAGCHYVTYGLSGIVHAGNCPNPVHGER